MNRKERKQAKKNIEKRFSNILQPVKKNAWPEIENENIINVWASIKFLVQIFDETESAPGKMPLHRVSVHSTDILPDGNWSDDISWDDLMQIKREIGYGNYFAIEIYPEDINIVNVANMRHLWVFLENPLSIGWRRK